MVGTWRRVRSPYSEPKEGADVAGWYSGDPPGPSRDGAQLDGFAAERNWELEFCSKSGAKDRSMCQLPLLISLPNLNFNQGLVRPLGLSRHL